MDNYSENLSDDDGEHNRYAVPTIKKREKKFDENLDQLVKVVVSLISIYYLGISHNELTANWTYFTVREQ